MPSIPILDSIGVVGKAVILENNNYIDWQGEKPCHAALTKAYW